MIAALALLAATAAAPLPAPVRAKTLPPASTALADARTIASNGTMAALLPLIVANDAEEMVKAHPELSRAEAETLRQTARKVGNAQISRLIESEARVLAEELSPADLAHLAATSRSSASANFRRALPRILGQTMSAVGSFDLKGEVQRSFCQSTGKLCSSR